jgi:hypothetical protein
MVTFKNFGRMGNYLFQVAATIGYSLRYHIPFTVPSRTEDTKNNPIYLQHLVNPAWDPKLPEVRIEEHGHAYQNLQFKEEWRLTHNIVLDGYWQSEKYFVEHRVKVLELFSYPWMLQPGLVSVHVRRGDYLQLAHKHPFISKLWYYECMERFPGFAFKFFSDDIAWCRQEFGHIGGCLFSSNITEVDDLIEISTCEHHISSASTFSWWGAWLNRNPKKRVVIPQLWFTPREMVKLDTRDIVPSSWEKV